MARNRFVPAVTVKVINAPDITASGLRYSSVHGNHEVAVLRTVDGWVNAETLPQGSPIHITWANDFGSRNFYGYVHSHTKRDSMAAIFCVGATWNLKTKGGQIWKNRTADMIVKEICRNAGLEAVTVPHPHVYKYFAQENLTYWGVLKFLAQQTGYVLHADGTRVYFVPWDYWVQHQQGLSPYFLQNSSGGQTGQADSTLVEFIPDMADNHVDAGASAEQAIVTGVDSAGHPYVVVGAAASTISGTARAVGATTYSSSTLTDASLAKSISDAWASNNRFNYRANVVLAGNPLVQADMPLYLDGLGSSNGLWTALEVHHRFSIKGEYEIRGVVGSDGLPKVNKSMPAANQSSLTDGWKSTMPMNVETIKAGLTTPAKANLRSLEKVVLPTVVSGKTHRWSAT